MVCAKHTKRSACPVVLPLLVFKDEGYADRDRHNDPTFWIVKGDCGAMFELASYFDRASIFSC